MNKGRSSGNIVLVGLLLIGAILYPIWCARVFWMLPGISFGKGVPNEAMGKISAWHESKRHFGPEKFSWNHYLAILKSPRDGAPKPVLVRRVTDRLMIATQTAKSVSGPRFIHGIDNWKSIEVLKSQSLSTGEPELSETEKGKLLMSLPDVLSTD